jgi:ribosomal-protein-alanine N-acetyltransferase
MAADVLAPRAFGASGDWCREKRTKEHDTRDAPAAGARSVLGRRAGDECTPHPESTRDPDTGLAATPRVQGHMPDLQLLRRDHAPALLAFERENRAYFAAAIPDRGVAFCAAFDTHYAHLLAEQAAWTAYFHLLVAEGGAVVGRVNLNEVADGSAELGYRIGQQAAGRGLATAAVRQVCELAATTYGLSRLRARVTLDNPASITVLERNGFVASGELTLNGKPARSYRFELR